MNEEIFFIQIIKMFVYHLVLLFDTTKLEHVIRIFNV